MDDAHLENIKICVKNAMAEAATIPPEQKLVMCNQDIYTCEVYLGILHQKAPPKTPEDEQNRRMTQDKLLAMYAARQRIEAQILQLSYQTLLRHVAHLENVVKQ